MSSDGIKLGNWYYYTNGNLKEIMFHGKGDQIKVVDKWDEKGKQIIKNGFGFDTTCCNPEDSSYRIHFYLDSLIIKIEEYSCDHKLLLRFGYMYFRHGMFQEWYLNGFLKKEGLYEDGEKRGLWVFYDSTGRRKYIVNYLPDSTASIISYGYFSNGKLKYVKRYFDKVYIIKEIADGIYDVNERDFENYCPNGEWITYNLKGEVVNTKNFTCEKFKDRGQ